MGGTAHALRLGVEGSGNVTLRNEMEKYERIRVVGRGAFG